MPNGGYGEVDHRDPQVAYLEDELSHIFFTLNDETRTYKLEYRQHLVTKGIFLTLRLMECRGRIPKDELDSLNKIISSWVQPKRWYQFWR